MRKFVFVFVLFAGVVAAHLQGAEATAVGVVVIRAHEQTSANADSVVAYLPSIFFELDQPTKTTGRITVSGPSGQSWDLSPAGGTSNQWNAPFFSPYASLPELYASVPVGLYQFSAASLGFNFSERLGAADFPPAARITATTGTPISGGTPTIQISWRAASGAFRTNDSIAVAVTDEEGEVISTTPGPDEPGEILGTSMTSITLPAIPGRNLMINVSVLRRTAGTKPVFMGYGTITVAPFFTAGTPDRIAPSLSRATYVSPTEIKLEFNEPMRESGHIKYAIGNGDPQDPAQAYTLSSDRKTFTFKFAEPLPNGSINLLLQESPDKFFDVSGNYLPAGSTSIFVGDRPAVNFPDRVYGAGTVAPQVSWGDGGLTYQWYFNDTAIPGANAPTFDVPRDYLKTGGFLYLIIGYGDGKTFTTRKAIVEKEITTESLILIASGAANRTLNGNYIVSPGFGFRIIGPNLPVGEVKWYKDGNLITPSGSNWYDVKEAAASDSGVYTLSVRNGESTRFSNAIVITVSMGQPLPDRFFQGEKPIVSDWPCEISSLYNNDPLGFAYWWTKDGIPLGRKYDRPASLLLGKFSTDMGPTQPGVYREIISNGIEQKTLQEWTLTAAGTLPGYFEVKSPVLVKSRTRGSVSLDPKAVWLPVGQNKLSYRWTKDGEVLTDQTKSGMQTPEGARAAGNYACQMIYEGNVVATAEFRVEWNPIERIAQSKSVYTAGSTIDAWVIHNLPDKPPFTWFKGDVAVGEGTTLTIARSQTSDTGAYRVRFLDGTTEYWSDPVNITVVGLDDKPVITVPNPGVYSANIASKSEVTVRWLVNGKPATGTVSTSLPTTSLELTPNQKLSGASITLQATNQAGTSVYEFLPYKPNLPTQSDARLYNLSTRAFAGASDQTLILGFYIDGPVPKRLLIRGVGNGLTQFGLSQVANDASILLYDQGTLVRSNDDWTQGNEIIEFDSEQRVRGAFRLPIDGDDAAMVVNLNPGNYTLHLNPKKGAGVALVELYDGDDGHSLSRIANLSTRAFVGAEMSEAAIPGISVRGATPKTYLIRAVGPGLASFGVLGVLTDPILTLRSERSSEPYATNDDWEQDQTATPKLFESAGAFQLNPGSKDAAMVVTLKPGNYTAVTTGKNGQAGVVLLEVYELP